jgi:o-succinylbenzoate synthase
MDLVKRPFAVGMRIPFRGVKERAGVLIKGPHGWGEFSPFPDYGPRVAARWFEAALEAATRAWPEPRRQVIPVNVTVPAIEPDAAHSLVASSGCTTAKVKVGTDGDVARVEAVRDALGPHGHLRVDANAAWDFDEAQRAIRELARFDLEYVEQPVADLADMARLRRRIDVPLAADESVRTADDPTRIAGIGAADVVVLKVQPLGGVHNALAVAQAAGLPVVVSSAVETSVGIAAGVAFAAALPELPYACGLGTVSLLSGDVVADPMLPRDGFLEVRRPEVDDAALQALEPDGARKGELLARLEAARHAFEERA